MKKHTILHAWEKAGLFPFNPKVVLEHLEHLKEFEPPPEDRFRTPSPEVTIDWKSANTLVNSASIIKEYSDYVDNRLLGAINLSQPLAPTVA
jgi:hypothetical protein